MNLTSTVNWPDTGALSFSLYELKQRVRRYSQHTDGYHCLKFDSSKSVSETGVAFKKYQQDTFTDVALTMADLPVDKRPADPVDFKMCPILVQNRCTHPRTPPVHPPYTPVHPVHPRTPPVYPRTPPRTPPYTPVHC